VETEHRAPVQSDRFEGPPETRHLRVHPAGTVAWYEHETAWIAYNKKYRGNQSAERIAERGGFGYIELTDFLGYEPKTWLPK